MEALDGRSIGGGCGGREIEVLGQFTARFCKRFGKSMYRFK